MKLRTVRLITFAIWIGFFAFLAVWGYFVVLFGMFLLEYGGWRG